MMMLLFTTAATIFIEDLINAHSRPLFVKMIIAALIDSHILASKSALNDGLALFLCSNFGLRCVNHRRCDFLASAVLVLSDFRLENLLSTLSLSNLLI